MPVHTSVFLLNLQAACNFIKKRDPDAGIFLQILINCWSLNDRSKKICKQLLLSSLYLKIIAQHCLIFQRSKSLGRISLYVFDEDLYETLVNFFLSPRKTLDSVEVGNNKTSSVLNIALTLDPLIVDDEALFWTLPLLLLLFMFW